MRLPLLKRRVGGNIRPTDPPVSSPPPPALAFDYPTSFTIYQGGTYDLSAYVSGGVPPYGSYAVNTGTLPSGVTLNSSTGVLSADAEATEGETTGLKFEVQDSA